MTSSGQYGSMIMSPEKAAQIVEELEGTTNPTLRRLRARLIPFVSGEVDFVRLTGAQIDALSEELAPWGTTEFEGEKHGKMPEFERNAPFSYGGGFGTYAHKEGVEPPMNPEEAMERDPLIERGLYRTRQ